MLSLRFIHPLPELLVVTFAPALVALALSGGVRAYFRQNARVAALVSGLAGGTWLIVSAGRDENVPAILIGAMVSFLLMIGLALLGTMVVDRVTSRRAAWRG